MQELHRILLISLFLFPLLFLTCSLRCEETQYPWPYKQPRQCCDKCKPGQRMRQRCIPGSKPTVCEDCGDGYYSDSNNVDLQCKACSGCGMSQLVYNLNCSRTHNSLCGCAPGFRCTSQPCSDCEKIGAPWASPSTVKGTRITNQHTQTETQVMVIYEKHQGKTGTGPNGEQNESGLPKRPHFSTKVKKWRPKNQSRKCVENVTRVILYIASGEERAVITVITGNKGSRSRSRITYNDVDMKTGSNCVISHLISE